MKYKYIDLISQTFDFPQEEFDVNDGKLTFHKVDLMKIIEEHGTPLKFTYLPKISNNINRAKKWFADAIRKLDYSGEYNYCYCTKSSHFSYVLERVLSEGVHLETSSAFDIDIIENLERKGKIDKKKKVICNGFKTEDYATKIAGLINSGYESVWPVIDNYKELDVIEQKAEKPFEVGIRIASEEEPKFEFYTSRLGIGYRNIVPFYK
jgi:arginine decarboxylase